jgi:curved DNA-binding protein CbpA
MIGGDILLKKPKLPACFQVLGFDRIPDREQLKARYRQLARVVHPDSGGNVEKFIRVRRAYEESIKYIEQRKGG